MAKHKLKPTAADGCDLMVRQVLEGADDVNVVVGPLLERPEVGDYFVVATSKNHEVRFNQMTIGGTLDADVVRGGFFLALIERGGALISHDTGDEVYMLKLCETIWPHDTRVKRMRLEMEAERAANGGKAL